MTASAALQNVLSATRRQISVTEHTLLCSDGLKLAAQHWTLPDNNNDNGSDEAARRKILCLHGWLDNCRSFYQLAPALVASSSLPSCPVVVALDFPGHGHSDHKGPDGPPQVMSELAWYVAEAVRLLQWDSFTLVGHSMGAAVSSMYAAAFPEQVEKLVLLEGGGPLYRSSQDMAKHLRAAIERRQAGNPTLYPQFSRQTSSSSSSSLNVTKKAPRIYPTLELAVETRCKTASLSPGNQYLSMEAARELVERATVRDGGGVRFRHDPRLQWPSLQYATQQQSEGLLKNVKSPTCLLLAKDGWPIDKERLQRSVEFLEPTMYETLEGSHHFHADPDTADNVIEHVIKFLQDEQVRHPPTEE